MQQANYLLFYRDLSNNLLTSLGPNAFEHLNRLKRLDLSGNHMIDISEEAFSHLPSLEVL
jgi:Leucine-rich repeat (LRR) protein